MKWIILLWTSIATSTAVGILVYEWLPQFTHRGFALPLGIVVFGVVHWVLHLKICNRPSDKNTPVLNIDDSKLTMSYPDGESGTVVIADVSKIEVLTTDEGLCCYHS